MASTLTRGRGAASATILMFCMFTRSSRPFLPRSTPPRALPRLEHIKASSKWRKNALPEVSTCPSTAVTAMSTPFDGRTMVRSGRPSEGLRRLANRPIGRSLSAGQGFGERSTPPEPDKTTRGPGSDPNVEGAPVKRAKSLMPLADAASKLLPKQNADGSVQFNNPGVGDFQVLDSLVEYPGNFELKIIGLNEAGFVSDMRRAVAGCLTKGDENVVSCTTREKGRYTSITLKVFVENSAQLYKCYEVINEDSRVKFKF